MNECMLKTSFIHGIFKMEGIKMTYLYESQYDYEYNSARILFEMAIEDYNKENHETILLEDGED